jgi:hypothetical protein
MSGKSAVAWHHCARSPKPPAKLCVDGVRQIQPERMSGVEIHDRHQVQKSHLEWDLGDDGGLHLIHRSDRSEIHKAGKPFRRIADDGDAWPLVDRH